MPLRYWLSVLQQTLTMMFPQGCPCSSITLELGGVLEGQILEGQVLEVFLRY